MLIFKSFQWQPSYSMWTDGWTDNHHKPNIRFSEMCKMTNRVPFVLHVKYLQGTNLLSSESELQRLIMA